MGAFKNRLDVAWIMATIDFATPLLGDFATHLEIAFGATMGWFVGHLIIVAIVVILIQSLRNGSLLVNRFEINSNRITNFIGYGIFFIIQYQIFISFSFPISGAFFTAAASTLLWKWTFETLTPTNV
jgi:hypothetical protein